MRRIIVLRPNHRLGNTILLTPLFTELERRYPKAQIELVTTGPAAQAVFGRFAQISAMHMFPANSFHGPGRVLRILASLRYRTYDLAIDPTPHSRSGRFILRLLRARARVGFKWGNRARDAMLTHAVDAPTGPMPVAQLPVYLLRAAGSAAAAANGGAAATPPTLRLTDAERRQGQVQLCRALGIDVGQPVHCVGIFAHATGEKCFPEEWWRRVVMQLRDQSPHVKVVEFVPADGRPRLAGDVPTLRSPNLRKLGGMLAATSLVVIADCGVMHLADAAGARVLALFRSTDPSLYGPSHSASQSVWAADQNSNNIASSIRAALVDAPVPLV